MLKSFVLGCAILLFANGAWIMVLKSTTYPAILVWTLRLLPAVAAFLVAYLAPHDKIALGLSMAFCAAALTTLSSLLFEAIGLPADSVGFQGQAIIFLINLGSNALICAAGSIGGYLLARKSIRI